MLTAGRPGRAPGGSSGPADDGTPPRHWLDRPLVFFGGKGGVGKTTCAVAWALATSRLGRRTLLVSTDPAHSTSDLLGVPLGASERRVTEHLWAQELDAAKEAEEYVDRIRTDLLRRVPERLRPEMERQVEMARVTPGAEEAALFDRVAEIALAQGDTWDTIVFDTAPTGHTLRLLALPELLQTWIDGLLDRRQRIQKLSELWRRNLLGDGGDAAAQDPVERVLGARRRTFHQLRERLLDPERTVFAFVLTAERLPILETGRAVATLRRHGVPVGGMVVNRLLPASAADHPFLAARREQERQHLEEIERTFHDLPRLALPLLPHDVGGKEGLEEIVGELARQTAGAR